MKERGYKERERQGKRKEKKKVTPAWRQHWYSPRCAPHQILEIKEKVIFVDSESGLFFVL